MFLVILDHSIMFLYAFYICYVYILDLTLNKIKYVNIIFKYIITWEQLGTGRDGRVRERRLWGVT